MSVYHQNYPRRHQWTVAKIHFGESAQSICELSVLRVSSRATGMLRSLDTESANTCTPLRHISCWLDTLTTVTPCWPDHQCPPLTGSSGCWMRQLVFPSIRTRT